MKLFDNFYYSIIYDNALIESVIKIQLLVAVVLLGNLIRLLVTTPSAETNRSGNSVCDVHLLPPSSTTSISRIPVRLERIPSAKVKA
jgi:hypothetical protein